MVTFLKQYIIIDFRLALVIVTITVYINLQVVIVVSLEALWLHECGTYSEVGARCGISLTLMRAAKVWIPRRSASSLTLDVNGNKAMILPVAVVLLNICFVQ